MTANTNLKELIFWLIFTACAALIALWLIKMGQESSMNYDNFIFTKTIPAEFSE